MKIQFFKVLTAVVFCLYLSSCSLNKLAINAVSNALTGEGNTDVFTSDPDPQLVGDAIPFAIKIYETLLSANPTHHGLMVTTGSLFVMYANAFVQGPTEQLPPVDWKGRETGMMRAKQLYLRGYTILCNALDAKFKGFKQASAEDGSLDTILSKCKKEDVGLLYWTVAGGLAAYSIDIFDFDLSVNVPNWSRMIHRAYELDPDFNGTAIDEFFILFYASLPELMGGDKEKAKFHFQEAVKKSKGNSVSAYVSYAQSISVPAQDYESYKDCLEKALDIDTDADKSIRLVNIISQRKARWLLDNAYNYFSFLPIPDDY